MYNNLFSEITIKGLTLKNRLTKDTYAISTK